MSNRIKLGELLVRALPVDEHQPRVALAEQHCRGGRLGRILVERVSISQEIRVEAPSRQPGIPPATFDGPELPAPIQRGGVHSGDGAIRRADGRSRGRVPARARTSPGLAGRGLLERGRARRGIGQRTHEQSLRLESAQRQRPRAPRVIVELSIEKGVFSRETYLATVQRR
jgi:hypothetical protein